MIVTKIPYGQKHLLTWSIHVWVDSFDFDETLKSTDIYKDISWYKLYDKEIKVVVASGYRMIPS